MASFLDRMSRGFKGAALGSLGGVAGASTLGTIGLMGGDPIGGTKDVLRTVPVVNNLLGLTSPEEMAANRQREALAQSYAQLGQQYQPLMEQYNQYTGLASALPGIQERAAAGFYSPQQRMQTYSGYLPQYNQYQAPESFKYNLQEDPGYQFAKEQGLGAVEARMAQRGLTGSGREKAELAKYATGLAAQYAPQMRQQAFNEYQSQRGMGLGEYQQNVANLFSRAQLAQNLAQQRYGQELGLAQLANQQSAQRYGQELGLAQLGLGALGAQTDLATQLAQMQSGITQQRGQVSAAQKMAEAAGIRGMINQGSQLLAMGMGAPPGMAPQMQTQQPVQTGLAQYGSFG